MEMRKAIAGMIALFVFALVALSITQTDEWQESGDGSAEDMDTLVQALFTDHVIALEVLGVLLTAAMIGALVIARPLGAEEDSENYEPADTSAPSSAPVVAATSATEEE